MYAAVSQTARRLCHQQLQRISIARVGHIQLHTKAFNYVAARQTDHVPFARQRDERSYRMRRGFEPHADQRGRRQQTHGDEAESSQGELQDIITSLRSSLTSWRIIKIHQVLPAITMLEGMANKRQEHRDTSYLNSIPNLIEILLASCGEQMVNEFAPVRERLASIIWSCVKKLGLKLTISHYNTLLKLFLDNGTPFDPSKLLAEMHAKGITPNRVTYQRILDRYCRMGEMGEAFKVLEHMKENQMEISESIFKSLIVGYGMNKDMESVKQIFPLMRSHELEPGPLTYVAYICAAIDNGASEEEIKDILKEAEDSGIEPDRQDRLDLLLSLAKKDENHPLIEEMMRHIEVPLAGPKDFVVTHLYINKLIEENLYKSASRIFWSINHRATNAGASKTGSFYLNALAWKDSVPVEFIMKECQALRDKGLNAEPYRHLFPIAATSERHDLIEPIVERLGEKRFHYYWPLLAGAKPKDVSNVMARIYQRDIEPQDLDDTLQMMVWPKLGKTLHIEEAIRSLIDAGFNKSIIISSYVEYALETGELSQLEKIASSFQDVEITDNVTRRSKEKLELNSETIRKFMLELMSSGEMTKDILSIYLLLVKCFSTTVCSVDIMERLLRAKKNDDLEKLTEALNLVQGESRTLTDLAFACVRGGLVKQADKIFRSPTVRVDVSKVDYCVNYFYSRNRINDLENLIKATRGLPSAHTEKAYLTLFTLYNEKNNATKTLELCTQAQEDGKQLSRESLLIAGSTLERNKMELPFTKPELFSNEL